MSYSYSDIEKLRYGTTDEFDSVAKQLNPKYIAPPKPSRKAVRQMYIDILQNGTMDVFNNLETNDQPTTSLDMKNCIDKNTTKLEMVDGYNPEESAKIAIANCKSFQSVLQDKFQEYVEKLPSSTKPEEFFQNLSQSKSSILGGKRRRQSKKKRNSRCRKHKSLHKR